MRPTSLACLGAALCALMSCASEDYTRLYYTQDVAPSLSWEELSTLDYMGPTVIDRGVNFAVYAARAERIELLLFDDPEADLPTWQIPMTQEGDLWSVYVEGVGHGQHYGYIAWGPNWEHDERFFPGSTLGFRTDVDEHGNRYNPNKLLTDPYSLALHRDFDWSKGNPASGPQRHTSSWAASPKSVVLARDDFQWSEEEATWRQLRQSGEHPGHGPADLILYEVHPKGFTANVASGVDHPGTFRGVGEMAAYLQDLGVTAVELLPIHEKPLDGGYWGYNNTSWFAPEVSMSADYAATGEPSAVLDELRWMVDQLHQHDIEVIVDVVYNHTGEGGLWRERLYFDTFEDAYEVNFDPKEVAGLYSWRGLDNAAYYMLEDHGQTYWDYGTGVGNQIRTQHTPSRRMILDSLRFMVEELHVDGFRFDLAGILGVADKEAETDSYDSRINVAETVLMDIIDDPVLQQHNTRIIAEPWTADGSGPGIGGFPTSSDDPAYAWGEWNAHFRDWWRSFINDPDGWNKLNHTEGADGGSVMTGTEQTYGWNNRKPYHSVNFITVHDGFTLYDLVSYDEKQNGCGLLNPVCCDDPLSVWCDDDSGEDHNRSYNWGDEALKRQQMRNFFVAMMVSHGTPLILGGDEWMRTQYGNNNAYYIAADNEWNWFRWGEWRSTYAWHRHRMHDFVRDLIQLRKDRAYAFAPEGYGAGMPFTWRSASGGEMSGEDWSNNKHVNIHYSDGEHPDLAVLINMEGWDVEFQLPGGQWERLVDTQSWYDKPGTLDDDDVSGWFFDNPDADPYTSVNITLGEPEPVSGGAYGVKARTIVILEQR